MHDNCSITTPRGFKAAGVAAGIKYKDKKDIALITSDSPAAIAGVFTTNKVKAAPVLLCKKHIAEGTARAILINSGNANACTGKQGLADAEEMARVTARTLNIPIRTAFICSTGTIGIPMPMPTIRKGIALAVKRLSQNGGNDAARAIMTTDTRPKQACRRLTIGGRSISIAGMAKGSGMIAPNMATMLAFFTTDASINSASLQKCLKTAVDMSFNRVIVDGDTSTNDTVLVMANAAAGGRAITPRHPEWKRFCGAFNETAMELAMMIARDGEGATKLVSVTVKGALNMESARRAARAVASSPLVKTSWYGADPNWGRIMCAIGYSGAKIDPERIDIAFDRMMIVRKGQAARINEKLLRKIIASPEFRIGINLNMGTAEFTVHTCDYSEEYVRINSAYTT